MTPFLDTTHPSLGVALRVYEITSRDWEAR
jgi:hypothetical protein